MSKATVVTLLLILAAFAQEVGPTPAFIVALSDDAVKEIEAENKVIKDQRLMDRLLPVVRDIMAASDVRQVFPCRIIDAEEANAFALPAGPIYVTMGLLDVLDSLKTEEDRSMISGIIGHEIAHVYLRHFVAWARMQKFIKDASVSVPSDVAAVLDCGYKREQEFEADELGVLYAMRAGYRFESIVAFYKRIRDLYGEIPPGDEKFKDHPRITERIARLYEVRGQIERDFDQYNYGVQAIKEGRYPEAVSAFKIYTAAFSNSARGWTDLGSAYLYAALDQMDDIPVRFMVTYYSSPAEGLRGKPEELGLAEEAFKRAAELDTSYNVVYYGNLGIIAALNGDHDRAIGLERKALESGESECYFYNNLGNAYYLKKAYENAAESYRKALDLAGDWALPRYNLAVLYERAGEKDLAAGEWRKLLDISGFQADAIAHLKKLDKKFKPPSGAVAAETTLAGVSLGMDQDAVQNALGDPGSRSAVEKMIVLEFPARRVKVFMRNEKVSGVLAGEGSDGATAKGIRIGSNCAEVRSAYGLPDDIIPRNEEAQWVYNKYGLVLDVCDGEVDLIQIVRPR